MQTKNFSPPLLKLALLSGFCVLLEIVRLLATNRLSYIFLPGNLMLAWIPLLFSHLLMKENNKLKMFAFFTGWLLFFPNAPYIMTDLIHLKERNFPLWYDMLMIFSFAFTGFVVGMFSAIQVYQKLREYIPRIPARFVMLVAMLASGYGIYLGRFLRWYSWDVVLSPLSILSDTMQRFLNPTEHPRTYGVTLIVGVLLFLSFTIFESFTNKTENA